MTVSLLLLAILVSVFSESFGDSNHGNRKTKFMTRKFENDALFLTPYIENGRIEEAQQLAEVPSMLDDESFAGFLTVNKAFNSNLFFWLFKSRQGKWEDRPLIVWLQGGVGYSSLIGLFGDIGPFRVSKEQTLKKRHYSWNRRYNLVFIDNPVGSGFSFTDMDSGYARNLTDVAEDFYTALVQLHKLFPELKKNQLVITGESYGARYAVAIAYKIYKMNQVSAFKLNLSRLILASAHVDPLAWVKYGSNLYDIGLIDKNQQRQFKRQEEEILTNIWTGDYITAIKSHKEERKEIKNLTGFKDDLDFVSDKTGWNSSAPVVWFTSQSDVRKALHVGSYELNDGKKAADHMLGDFISTVKSLIEELLTAGTLPVMFVNGQLDMVGAYPLILEFYDSLQWPRAKEYHGAKRCQFKVGSKVAGYYKTAGTFTEVLQRNSGHLVGVGRPKWAFELVDKFIQNSTFFQCV